VYGTGRDWLGEGRSGADDLLSIVKRHITKDHVVEQTAKGPDCSRLGVIVAQLYVLRTYVHQRTWVRNIINDH